MDAESPESERRWIQCHVVGRDEAGGKPRLYSNEEGQVYPKEDSDTFLVTGRHSVEFGPLTELALKKAAFRIPVV